jgi:serine/threonine protein kinase
VSENSLAWARIEELFEQAAALPPAARTAFLTEIGDTDRALRLELESLLAVEDGGCALDVERFIVDARSSGDVSGHGGPADSREETIDRRIGTCLGSWRLVGVLGRGGMGTVYRVERADGLYHQQAALKLARSSPLDSLGMERFRTERQVLARLRHPNIAGLLDGGFAPDGTPYLVMELVDGVPITTWCETARLTIEARLRLVRVVCDAVQHAHRALVVHRDLKPANIFVTNSGEVKLLDFGIAKLLDPTAWNLEQPATVAGMRLLTPEYAAPEQRHDGDITAATDVYTLGVVLYELLAGVRPGTPPAPPSEVLRARRADTATARRVRGDLDRIVLTALREEPERRYVSAGQLGEEIGRFLEGRPVLAQPDTATYRLRTFVRRHRVGVAAAAALVCSLTVFGAVATIQARALAAQGRVAREERDKAEQIVRLLVELFESTNPSIRPDGDRITIGEFLGGAEARALAQLQSAPVVRAKMQQVFGLIKHTRGNFAAAGAALDEALVAERRLLGPDHPDALESLHALGEVRREAGDDERATALLRESLDRHRRVYGPEHEKTARALFALAPLVDRDDRPKAGALLEEALAIRRRVLPPGDPAIAGNIASLGEYHRRIGKFDRARALYQEALALARDSGDAHSTRFVGLMNDYGSFLGETGDHAEAERMQREALALGRELLGNRSIPVANLLNNLGVTLSLLGRRRDAEATFREAFDRHADVLGPNHWRTRNAARNVGRSLALQQRYADGVAWMDRALEVSTGARRDRDPGRLGIASQRSVMLFHLGRREDAIRELRGQTEALAAMKTDQAESVRVWVNLLLARALNDTGRPAEAEPMLAATVSWLERFPADHPRRAEADCERARSQLLQRDSAAARATLDRCLPIYRRWGLAEREIVAGLVAAAARPDAAVSTSQPGRRDPHR